jgi:hypothetical protein
MNSSLAGAQVGRPTFIVNERLNAIRLPTLRANRLTPKNVDKWCHDIKGGCWLTLGALVALVQCRYIGWNEPCFLLVVILLWWYFKLARTALQVYRARQSGAYT